MAKWGKSHPTSWTYKLKWSGPNGFANLSIYTIFIYLKGILLGHSYMNKGMGFHRFPNTHWTISRGSDICALQSQCGLASRRHAHITRPHGNRKFRNGNSELRIENSELRIQNWELRIQNWELRIQNWEFRIENWKLSFLATVIFEIPIAINIHYSSSLAAYWGEWPDTQLCVESRS